MAATGVLDQYLTQARRRLLTNLALNEAAVALSVGAIGAILLLLVGTQVLNWYWPVLLFALALGFGLWRMRRRIPSEYRVAQHIDARLGLADRISTVVYFRNIVQSTPPGISTVEQQALQRLTGEEIVRATPVSCPKSAYYSLALLFMASGMLVVRYGVLHTLDLRQPLANFESNTFQEPKVEAKTTKSAIQERFEQQLKQLGLSIEDLDAPEAKGERPKEASVSALNTPQGEGDGSGPEKGQQAPGLKVNNDNKDGSDGAEQGEDAASGEGSGKPDPGASGNAKEGKPQPPPPGAKPSGNGSKEDSGLMAKMKDALSNLMNKLKTPGAQNQQTAMSQQPSQSRGQQQSASQKGMQSQSRSQGEGEAAQDQEGKGDAESSENMPGNQSRPGDKSSDRAGGQEPKSGMGKQDGSKDIKEAEQLAAMGKISEIFGKRAAQINGEMTIEVPAGKQQLKTAYSDKKALHADLGGEVNRDEIPLMYQTYVQRYFEQVRKHPVKPKAQ